MTKAIKEVIIMLLICLIAMLALAIGLYKYIPSKKNIPEVVQYEVSEQVQDLLEDNIDKKSDKDRVILTYEVTKGELSGYQTTNDYIPGKSNPFGDVNKTIAEDENESSIESTDENGEKTSQKKSDEKDREQKVEPSNPSVYEENGKK